MRIIDFLAAISEKMPGFPLESSSAEKLLLINQEYTPKKYVTASFLVAVIIGLVVFPFYSITGMLFSFAGCFFIFLKLPEIEMKIIDEGREAELPVVLTNLCLHLKTGIQFKRALELSCEDGEFSKSMHEALRNVESGSTIQSAFAQLYSKTNSPRVKMAISQILSTYEHGGEAREIGTFADSMLSLQHHKLRDTSSKLGMIGLVFVTVSVVAPTFFLIGAVLSKPLFDVEIGTAQLAIIMLVLFPMISFAVLYTGNAVMPAFYLSETKSRRNMNPYSTYILEKKIEEIENALPDALIAMSTLPKGANIKKIIGVIANSSSKELTTEGQIMLRQLESGINPQKALEDFYIRNRTPIVRRTVTAIEQIVGTGRMESVSSVAESIIKFFEIKRARANILSMHKYTLIFGALLVPAIMAGTISFTRNLTTGLGEPDMIITQAPEIISIYLIIYSVLVSVYIADVEGKRSLALPYAGILSFVSVMLFNTLGMVWG
ncbi:TPA: type II secretion system F family protein [Candidatus Micrarchaeota archaeon]|nr:type II secretion system F family protein [Candidatus Micrarchaeota archaeon]